MWFRIKLLGDFYKNISFEKIQLVYQDPFSSFNPKLKLKILLMK